MPVWLVRGPCLLRAARGSEINGYEITESSEVVVPIGRAVFYMSNSPPVTSDCTVEKAPSQDYEAYKSLAKRVASQANRIILVGPSDSGKTTLASFIASSMGAARYVTTDVGQNEIYSPAFEAAATVEGVLIPGAVENDTGRCFVGAFSPSRALARYLKCAALLAHGSRLIVDTDGWVTPWEGLDSKAALSRAVRADLIVAVGLDDRSVSYLKLETGLEAVVSPPLARGQGKSRDDRRVHRERLIAKRLQGAKKYTINPETVPVHGAPIFRGTPLGREEAEMLAKGLGRVRVLYAERSSEGITLIVQGRATARLPGLRLLRPNWAEGLVACTVCNGKPGIALVLGVTYKPPRIRVASHCMPERLVIGVDKVRLEGYTFS